jgi:hypothetical protein
LRRKHDESQEPFIPPEAKPEEIARRDEGTRIWQARTEARMMALAKCVLLLSFTTAKLLERPLVMKHFRLLLLFALTVNLGVLAYADEPLQEATVKSTKQVTENVKGDSSQGGFFGGYNSVSHQIEINYAWLQVEDVEYKVACTRKMRWDRCPTLVAGKTYKIKVLSSGNKIGIFALDSKKMSTLNVVESKTTSKRND